MKIVANIQRFVIASLIALTLGFAAAPQATASVATLTTMSSDTRVLPTNGGGKDGTETHGRRDGGVMFDGDGHETHG